jgi:hypothetical protein
MFWFQKTSPTWEKGIRGLSLLVYTHLAPVISHTCVHAFGGRGGGTRKAQV